MNKKNELKVIVAFAVALAFILPTSAAFANVETFGITPNSENTDNMENMVESTTNSDNSDNTEDTIDNAMPTTGKTIYVDDDRPPEWYNETQVRTITEGITNATAGDTVYVYNGTYYEHVTVDKQLDLVGESRENVIVEGNGSGNVVYVTVNDVSIDTFTMTKGFYGIYLLSSSNSNIIDCDIYNNSGYGIYLYEYSDGNRIDGCHIYNNTNYAIYVYTAESNEVMNCDLEGGVNIVYDAHSNTLLNCSMYNGKRGINNERSDYTTITNCTIYDNSEYGIRLYRSAYCTLTGNTMYDNKVNFEVKGSFMEPGDVTHYTHYIDPTNTVSGKPMYYILDEHDEIYDGSLNFGFLALISCDNITAKDADVGGVILVNSIDSLISNITSHGAANGIFLAFSYHNDIEGCTVYDNDYGINIDDSSYRAHVKNCVAYNNSKSGIYNREWSDHNTIENCIAYNNGYHGIDVYDSENVSVINCTSYNNNQHGFKARFNIIDITFEDCTAYDNKQDGFYIDGFGMGPSGENRFTNCKSYNNVEDGFLMRFCSGGNLTNCDFYDNGECNFVIDGIYISHYAHNIDPASTVDGKPIFYITEQSDLELNETHNFGYLGLISCTNITVKNSDVQGMVIVDTTESTISNITSHTSKVGITLQDSSYNTLTDCYTYGCVYDLGGNHGIKVSGSEHNTFERCTSNGNRGGIHFYDSPNNNILNCTSCDSQGASEDGIWLQYSDNCNIEGCDTYNNAYGIRIYSSCNGGRIVNNSIHHNTGYGIYIGTSSSNHLIYHNIFASNGQNARDRSSNQWDNGYPSGGNYWDDYIGVDEYSGPGQNISGSDGIGDTPYIVPDGLNQDNYPFMPSPDETPPMITDVVLATSDPLDTDAPYGWENVTCNVTDNIAVATVKLVVTGPVMTTIEYTMTNIPGTDTYYYNTTFTDAGYYNYSVWADDASSNNATSTPEQFGLPLNEDVDMNGKVHFMDLIAVSLMYNDEGPDGWVREDVDNNGKVHFMDLVAISLAYNQEWK